MVSTVYFESWLIFQKLLFKTWESNHKGIHGIMGKILGGLFVFLKKVRKLKFTEVE